MKDTTKKEKDRKDRKRGIGRITIPIIALLLVFLLVGNIACVMLSGILDVYIGRGEMIISHVEGSENWDTEYYKSEYATAEEADAFAKQTTVAIAEEGIVLMKNDNAALPLNLDSEGAVTLLGRRSVDNVMGGTGSGAGDTYQCTLLADALTQSGFQVNPTLVELYTVNLNNVPVQKTNMDNPQSTTYYIGEFPQSYYTDNVTSSYAAYNGAAILVFGRQGGEGLDFATDLRGKLEPGVSAMDSSVAETANYREGQHQLELSVEEEQLVNHAAANFDKVIVVINSANVMELGELQDDPRVDAILWIAYPGSRGNVALANILKGAVNPSGHTVDTWMTDMTSDPVFVNTAAQPYSNISKSNALGDGYVLEYEEGIYFGYRYYETVYADGGTFTVEGETGKSYDDAVVYPFGYGLSYTTFSQKIKNVKVSNGQIIVTVTVENTGSVAGKDVVQVYYHPPYTKGGIEKSATVLAGYTKTKLLAPGEKADYTVTFSEESMASYDYLTNKCYVLDSGDYIITVNRNAHEVYGDDCSYTHTVKKTVVYNAENPRETEKEAQIGEYVNLSDAAKLSHEVQAAVNRFDDLNAHFVHYTKAQGGLSTAFTRENFAASFPTAPTAEDLIASESTIAHFNLYTADYYDENDVMPTTGAEQLLTVVALRGATYDDPRWDMLLDQMTARQMNQLISSGNQGTINVKSVGLPASTSTDGPAGLKQYGGLGFGTSGNFNCSATLTAATWNVELAKLFGISVGNEAQLASMDGWYAPGCDIHRSPFGGRNFEYYSEDPLISGLTCAATIEGAASRGLVCYFKHFVLNEMESHRIDRGFATWCNEQALREIYLRAYEIAVKNPLMNLSYLTSEGERVERTIRATTGIMSSFNRIGNVWCGASAPLLNGVLRGEWGFIGTVITDYNSHDYMHVEDGVVHGNDLMLANQMTLPTKFANTKEASTVLAMRQACKNIIYTLTNSGAVNGLSDSVSITYETSPWIIWLMQLDLVIVAIIILLILLTILLRKRRKNIEVVPQ